MNLLAYFIVLFILSATFIFIATFSTINIYFKYLKIKNSKGLYGYNLIEQMTIKNNLINIICKDDANFFQDHYDSKTHTLHLSKTNYYSDSIAAIGIVAHEISHVIISRENEFISKTRIIRNRINKILIILIFPFLLIGFIFNILSVLKFGFYMFLLLIGLLSIFVIIEWKVNKIAVSELESILEKSEIKNVKKVLYANLMTHIVFLTTAILALIKFKITEVGTNTGNL